MVNPNNAFRERGRLPNSSRPATELQKDYICNTMMAIVVKHGPFSGSWARACSAIGISPKPPNELTYTEAVKIQPVLDKRLNEPAVGI